jgi:hypothetical protein
MRRLLLPLVGLLLGGVLLWLVVWWLPPHFYPPLSGSEAAGQSGVQAQNDRLKLQNDARGTLLQGLGGAVLLLGAAFTWLQLRATREGQITDRYTKAVDQLGNKELAVRVGGVYALQRIARDSRDDRATIAEVLCAYARSAERKPRTEQDLESHTFEKRAPHVQAALTVLAEWWRRVGGEPAWRDLHGADSRTPALTGLVSHTPTSTMRSSSEPCCEARSWRRRTSSVPSCRMQTSPAPSCRMQTSGAPI